MADEFPKKFPRTPRNDEASAHTHIRTAGSRRRTGQFVFVQAEPQKGRAAPELRRDGTCPKERHTQGQQSITPTHLSFLFATIIAWQQTNNK
jgi:hypothetical protein